MGGELSGIELDGEGKFRSPCTFPLAILFTLDTLGGTCCYLFCYPRSMKCIVVTPEKTVLTQEANFVVLPLIDGEYGVLPNHAPLIARLGAGELRITGTDGQLTHYYLEGGFVEVLGDTVALLTMYSLPVRDLNLAQAEAELDKEQAYFADTASLAGIRQEKLIRQRARVRVARKVAGKTEDPL